MTNIIDQIEHEQVHDKKIPEFSFGDTVLVYTRVIEGGRERLQPFEGVVIAKRNRGISSSFTVRRMSQGEAVERKFKTYSPLIADIQVRSRGDVRQAKLYHLRQLSGRKARIKQRPPKSQKTKQSAAESQQNIESGD
jgi:large subunit ribosomal protein L19